MAQTNRQTDISTDGHGNSMTNSAQWGRVGENALRMDRKIHRHTDGHRDSMTDPAQRAESVKIVNYLETAQMNIYIKLVLEKEWI